MLVAATALAIIVTAGLLRWLPKHGVTNTLGVLYFDNLSDDSADVYLAEGLTEEIIARLGQIERLSVKSRNGFVAISGKDCRGPAALGRALRVMNLVSEACGGPGIAYESGWNWCVPTPEPACGVPSSIGPTRTSWRWKRMLRAPSRAPSPAVGRGGAACSGFGSNS